MTPMSSAILAAATAAIGTVAFRIRRFVARRAFALRERRRFARMVPTRWKTSAGLVATELARVNEVEGDAAINDKLLDRLLSARTEILTTSRRWSLISGILTVYLLLASYSIDLPVSLEGIDLKATPGVREVATLLMAIIGISLLSRGLALHHINVGINGLEELLFHPAVRPFIHAAHFPAEPPPHFSTKMQPELIWAPALVSFVRATGVFWLGFFFAAIGAIIWARLSVYVFVWTNPTIDPTLTRTLVALASVTDFATFILQLSHMVPLPIRDWSKVQEIEIARQTNMQTYDRLMAEVYRESIADLFEMRAKGYMENNEYEIGPKSTQSATSKAQK